MSVENIIEFFSCRVCKCEFLKYPEVFDFDKHFVNVSCASCGREVTKIELIELFDNRDRRPLRRLDVSMFE